MKKSKFKIYFPMGKDYYISLLLLLVIGILFYKNIISGFTFLSDYFTSINPNSVSQFIGVFLISISLSQFFIQIILIYINNKLDLQSDKYDEKDLWAPTFVGICESILYPGAFLSQNQELIGVWLAIKVAGQWLGWGGEKYENNNICPDDFVSIKKGRRRFNKFLVGNALRIFFSYITYIILRKYLILVYWEQSPVL
jgi:hypothetical protein